MNKQVMAKLQDRLRKLTLPLAFVQYLRVLIHDHRILKYRLGWALRQVGKCKSATSYIKSRALAWKKDLSADK